MNKIKNYFKIIFIFLLLVNIINCASIEKNQRRETISNKINPLIGKTIQEIFKILGEPEEIIKQDENKMIYIYINEYEVKDENIKKEKPYIYDWIKIYFENNKMTKWESNVLK